MAPFWFPKSNKIHQNSDLKKHQKMIEFFIGFWSVWGGNLGRKIDQKSMKIDLEMRPRSRSIFDRLLDRFSSTSASCVTTQMYVLPSKNICVEAQDAEVEENRSKTRSKIERKRGRISRSIFIDFDRFFVPRWPPKPTKNR